MQISLRLANYGSIAPHGKRASNVVTSMPKYYGVIMLKLALAASLTLALVPRVSAQAPTDHVKIDVTRADLQTIGQGIMKLPYETAAPLLIDLQKQLEAQTPKAEAPVPAAAAKPEAAAPAKK
jgi:hypothetical protein